MPTDASLPVLPVCTSRLREFRLRLLVPKFRAAPSTQRKRIPTWRTLLIHRVCDPMLPPPSAEPVVRICSGRVVLEGVVAVAAQIMAAKCKIAECLAA
eukprot:1131588-Alexandrium_andersonii.AAC.1